MPVYSRFQYVKDNTMPIFTFLNVSNVNTPEDTRIKTPSKDTRTCHWCRSDVMIDNFEQISHFCSGVSIADFKQVNVG